MTRSEIEAKVAEVRAHVEKQRRQLCIDAYSDRKLRDPALAIAALGYRFELVPDLGRGVAGIIDRQNERIRISQQYRVEVRNFTSGHELGHLILHPKSDRLHRDIPLDGGMRTASLPVHEREANYFAVCFLMPAADVKRSFQLRFGPTPLIIDEDVAHAVCPRDPGSLFDDNMGNVGAVLAAFRHSQVPVSIAQEYGVSVTAMAIRLKELQLFRYP